MISLQNYEIWLSKTRTNARFPLEVMWSNWNKQEILGWEWYNQEPQAQITSPFFPLLLFLPKLLAWGKRYFSLPASLPFLPQRASFSSPAWGATVCSQDAIDEDGHDGGTDEASDGHSHKPRHEDIPEQTPVHCLPWAHPSYCYHRAHLQIKQDKSP